MKFVLILNDFFAKCLWVLVLVTSISNWSSLSAQDLENFLINFISKWPPSVDVSVEGSESDSSSIYRDIQSTSKSSALKFDIGSRFKVIRIGPLGCAICVLLSTNRQNALFDELSLRLSSDKFDSWLSLGGVSLRVSHVYVS